VGLRAEHGFSALVTVRRRTNLTTLLFDTGLSPDPMVVSAERLGVDLGAVQAHCPNSRTLRPRRLGLLGSPAGPGRAHCRWWCARWSGLAAAWSFPGASRNKRTLRKRALEREGSQVIERREPSLLLDRSVLITGEVDRTAEYERGMPLPHQAWTGS
jgi:7,8-dihydropterin-6-yl-methyl-4-(beta-D-ribofuranosyl)aminobenzene 5'-phosphate synthase